MRSKTALLGIGVMSVIASTLAHAAPVRKPPCTLLPRQAASTLYGGPLGVNKETTGSMAACIYAGKTEDVVILMLMTIPNHADPNAMFALMTKGDAQTRIEPIPGLGERANFVLNNQHGKSMTLTALSHSVIVSLAVELPDSPSTRASLIATMKDILSHL